MRPLKTAFFTLIPIMLAASCSLVIYDTRKLLNDFHTTGFLDQDHYQVIVRGKPKAGSRGLVEGRKTALDDAAGRVNDTVIKGLSDYYISFYVRKNGLRGTMDIEGLPEFKERLAGELSRFLKYGHRAFEYYEPDHSAVLVYRLHKRRLLKSIESISVKPTLKQDVPASPANDRRER